MCVTIRWHCPLCHHFTGITKEYPCPPQNRCMGPSFFNRPLARELMQDWTCSNVCDYNSQAERQFEDKLLAIRALARSDDDDQRPGRSKEFYDSYEIERLSVTAAPHGSHHEIDVDEPEDHSISNYPSPPSPTRGSHAAHGHTASIAHGGPSRGSPSRTRHAPPHIDDYDDDEDCDDDDYQEAQSEASADRTESEPESEPKPEESSEFEEEEPEPDYYNYNNPPDLSRYVAWDGKRGTALTWSLIKKTSRTPKGHQIDFDKLNPTLRHRIDQLYRRNVQHYRDGAGWSESEKELLFLLKETLDFQTGNAMFGQDIYKNYFSYRTSAANQPHNMVEARANILRKDKGQAWWVQPERRRLLILGMDGPQMYSGSRANGHGARYSGNGKVRVETREANRGHFKGKGKEGEWRSG